MHIFYLRIKQILLTENELATVTMEMSNFNETAPIVQTTNADVAFSYIEEILHAV